MLFVRADLVPLPWPWPLRDFALLSGVLLGAA